MAENYKLNYTGEEVNNILNKANNMKEVTVDTTLSTTSINPVQNKVVATKINELSSSLGSKKTVVTSSKTITLTVGKSYFFILIGGGGGGGMRPSSSTASGGRGGNGGRNWGIYEPTSSSVSVTIGAGGAGSDVTNGSAGGSSSFAGITAAGGSGGARGTSSGSGAAGEDGENKFPGYTDRLIGINSKIM